MSMHIHRRADPARALSRSDGRAEDSLFSGWQPEAIEAYRRYLAGAASPAAPVPRPDGDAVSLLRSMYDAFRRRDARAVLGLMAPDVELTRSALLPWGGRRVGHDGAQSRHAAAGLTLGELLAADFADSFHGDSRGLLRA